MLAPLAGRTYNHAPQQNAVPLDRKHDRRLNQSILTFFSGVVAAMAPIFIYELGIKPWRERRSLARVIRSEVEFNVSALALAEAIRGTSSYYPVYDFLPSTKAYDSLVGRLGELPPEVLENVLMFYRGIAYLEAEHASLLQEQTRARELLNRIGLPQVAFGTFDRALATALEIAGELLPQLDETVGIALDDTRRPASYVDGVRSDARKTIKARGPST